MTEVFNTSAALRFREKRGDLLCAALWVVFEHEVARVLDHYDLGARDLLAEPVRARGRREHVVLAPQREQRDTQGSELPFVRLQLLEVARPVQVEDPLAAFL